MKRTWVIVVLLLVILPVVLWAGGQGEAGTEKVKLLHYGHTQPPFDGLIDRNIKKFMADNPNIEVEYAVFADPDLPNKILTSVAGGTPPDSFTIGGNYAAQFLSKDMCVPIDPAAFGKNSVKEVVDMWISGAFEGAGGFYKGNYYGIPHELSNYCAWINKTHMTEAGLSPDSDVPKTWEEFVEVGKKLTIDEGGVRKRNGFGVNFKTAGFVANVGFALLNGTDSGMLDRNGTKSLLDTPGGEKAVSTFTGWILKDKIFDPGLVTDDREGFGNGLLSMFLTGGAWYWGVMNSQYPDTYDQAKVFAYPRFKDGKDVGGISYGYSTFVTKASKHQKEAWMVADAIASTPDDFIREGLFQPRIGYSETVAAESLPSWDVFGSELKKATPRPVTQHYSEIVDIYYRAVSQIVYENVDVKSALSTAADRINNLVK